ncbi:MAG: T9SS type A sorting domain-containing protein [Ignavibacteriaceae bacterium]|nr:T9SS type A sorting domain-containing protein [Ignavibacteriaceae bacterium]
MKNILSLAYIETVPTNVEDENKSNIPTEYSLSQNYPNPFNPSTNIGFRISDRGYVSLKVFDILGNEVVTLVDEEKEPGVYEVQFDASNLSSGIYYYKLVSGNFIETKKMVLIK